MPDNRSETECHSDVSHGSQSEFHLNWRIFYIKWNDWNLRRHRKRAQTLCLNGFWLTTNLELGLHSKYHRWPLLCLWNASENSGTEWSILCDVLFRAKSEQNDCRSPAVRSKSEEQAFEWCGSGLSSFGLQQNEDIQRDDQPHGHRCGRLQIVGKPLRHYKKPFILMFYF